MKTMRLLGIGLSAYGLTVLCWSQLANSDLHPPHAAEFQKMANHSLRYFDAHQEAPKDTQHLPPELRRLVDNGRSGITWNPKTQTLTYTFARSFPEQIPLMYLLSFGLSSSPTQMRRGASISPDLMREYWWNGRTAPLAH
jgi:hypothetical protein